MDETKRNLPDPAQVDSSGEKTQRGAALNITIDTLHYQGNDIAELRKLAAQDPELARAVVAGRDKADRREHVSARLGMVLAGMLAIAAISGGVFIIVAIGWFQALVFVSVLLGGGHLLRVLLKGEWSETSWFGSILTGRNKPE